MRVQVVPESLSIYYHLYMYTSVPHACSIHYEVSCGLNPALLAVGLGVPSRFRDRGPRARHGGTLGFQGPEYFDTFKD